VHDVRVATETIQRVFRDIGVPHLVKTRRRRPKQLNCLRRNALAIPSRSTSSSPAEEDARSERRGRRE
jgi:hypothetical protein